MEILINWKKEIKKKDYYFGKIQLCHLWSS